MIEKAHVKCFAWERHITLDGLMSLYKNIFPNSMVFNQAKNCQIDLLN